MAEEYIWEMAWRRALGLTVLELLIPVLAGYIGLMIVFFRRRELAPGILCAFCMVFCPALPFGVLVALMFGWLRAGRWGIRTFMALWTGLVALVCLDVAGVLVLRNLDGATLRRVFSVQ